MFLLSQIGHDKAVSSDVTHQVQDRPNTIHSPIRATQLLWGGGETFSLISALWWEKNVF